MRKCVTIVLIAISFNLYAQSYYIDPINLSWRDYRGIVNYDSRWQAYTFCKVAITFDEHLKSKEGIEISIKFCPDSSWVDWQVLNKIPAANRDTLFRHELLHYYIGILVFKKLKLALQKLKFVDLKNTSKNLLEGTNFFIPFANLQKSLNAEYDTETRHGAVRERQKYWNDYIMRSLDSFKKVNIT